MRSRNFKGMVCSIAGALDAIGDGWAVLILRDLSAGISRYEELRRSTGVTNATLSDRLRHLEENGLIEKFIYDEGRQRFNYRLTHKGKGAQLVVRALAQVGDDWKVTGSAGPPMKFLNSKTNNPVKLRLVDQKTNEIVNSSHVKVVEGPGADDVVVWRLGHSGQRA